LMESVSRIEKTDGVIAASLVYHHGDQGGGP
jgi:nitrate reductase NapAB chaperone NapD